MLPLLVDTGFQDLFHSSIRGAFHLSLTVLVHYRWPRVFSLGGWSPQLPTRFLVSRGTQQYAERPLPFAYRTITFYGCPFQEHLAKERFSYSLLTLRGWSRRMLQPRPDIGPHSTKPDRFGLFPFRSPLLWESRLIYFPQVT